TDTAIVLGTVVLVMNDPVGGEERLVIKIKKVPPNQRPIIDSISLDKRFFYPDSTEMHIVASMMDTIEMQAFYHDTDEVDGAGLQGSWKAQAGTIIAQTNTTARYVALNSAYEDTVTFTAEDNLGFKAEQNIAIAVSYYPIIDSITVNETSYRPDGNDTLTYLATLQDTLDIVVWARDPSGGNVTVDLENKNRSMVSKTGRFSFQYLTNLPESDVDSTQIVIVGKDSLTTRQSLILSIHNRRPIIDSMLIGEHMYTSADPVYSYEATVLDSISLAAYAHDPDSEAVEIRWEVLRSEGESLLNGNEQTAEYVCLDSLYQDTILVTAVDETGAASEKKIVVLVNNSFPIIDSMRLNDISFVPVGRDDSLFYYESIAPDTIAFESFAHDPDVGDDISPEWQFRDQKQKLRVFKDRPSIEYISADSTYTDTVVLRVRDNRDATDTKKILMIFSK
ncbi:MAG: hypothetical protein ACOCW2_02720, partial [Chitinivibrionales bacterium]